MPDEVKFQAAAVLFDMDGTLVDSTTGVIRAWEAFAKTYPGLDGNTILRSSHGVRTKDTLARWCGISDPESLKEEAERLERTLVQSAEGGIKMLPGVRPILDNLSPAKNKPNQRWTICTSATRVYATAALEAAGIDSPDDFVTADDVHRGKPHPDPYLEGAARCNVKATDCVVIEDSPAGVVSGLAAGSRVIALLTTHSREQMLKAAEGAPQDYFYLVPDLTSVSVVLVDDGLGMEITIILT